MNNPSPERSTIEEPAIKQEQPAPIATENSNPNPTTHPDIPQEPNPIINSPRPDTNTEVLPPQSQTQTLTGNPSEIIDHMMDKTPDNLQGFSDMTDQLEIIQAQQK